jgi:hypothetical protein
MSISMNLTPALSLRAFSAATSSAALLMSTASIWANLSARASDMAIQPLPVPMSSTLRSVRPPLRPATMSTISAVSGRGISVSGVTA